MQLFLFGGVFLLQNLRTFFRTYRKQLQTAGVFLLLGLAYFLLTQLTPLRIPCIFQKITGFACPGCGMTHLCMRLLRLDRCSRRKPCRRLARSSLARRHSDTGAVESSLVFQR